MTERLLIPVCGGLEPDVVDIERHCADDGFIVTNVRKSPPDFFVCNSDGRMFVNNEDVWFWMADVVVREP